MRTIHSYRAQPLDNELELDPLTLVFDRGLEESPHTAKLDPAEGWRGRYATEATMIVWELRRALPGGLFDALAAAFLAAKASEFAVAYGDREDPPA